MNAVCSQAGDILSACFSSDMSKLSVFTEDSGSDSVGVRLLLVSTGVLYIYIGTVLQTTWCMVMMMMNE